MSKPYVDVMESSDNDNVDVYYIGWLKFSDMEDNTQVMEIKKEHLKDFVEELAKHIPSDSGTLKG